MNHLNQSTQMTTPIRKLPSTRFAITLSQVGKHGDASGRQRHCQSHSAGRTQTKASRLLIITSRTRMRPRQPHLAILAAQQPSQVNTDFNFVWKATTTVQRSAVPSTRSCKHHGILFPLLRFADADAIAATSTLQHQCPTTTTGAPNDTVGAVIRQRESSGGALPQAHIMRRHRHRHNV
jgi:hypothetical protein